MGEQFSCGVYSEDELVKMFGSGRFLGLKARSGGAQLSKSDRIKFLREVGGFLDVEYIKRSGGQYYVRGTKVPYLPADDNTGEIARFQLEHHFPLGLRLLQYLKEHDTYCFKPFSLAWELGVINENYVYSGEKNKLLTNFKARFNRGAEMTINEMVGLGIIADDHDTLFLIKDDGGGKRVKFKASEKQREWFDLQVDKTIDEFRIEKKVSDGENLMGLKSFQESLKKRLRYFEGIVDYSFEACLYICNEEVADDLLAAYNVGAVWYDYVAAMVKELCFGAVKYEDDAVKFWEYAANYFNPIYLPPHMTNNA